MDTNVITLFWFCPLTAFFLLLIGLSCCRQRNNMPRKTTRLSRARRVALVFCMKTLWNYLSRNKKNNSTVHRSRLSNYNDDVVPPLKQNRILNVKRCVYNNLRFRRRVSIRVVASLFFFIFDYREICMYSAKVVYGFYGRRQPTRFSNKCHLNVSENHPETRKAYLR